MWGGERGEQPSSSVGRWGSGEVQGAGTLHGAGTKKIPERCNDKMMLMYRDDVHAKVVATQVVGVWGRAKWWCVHIMLSRSGAMVSLVTLFDTTSHLGYVLPTPPI